MNAKRQNFTQYIFLLSNIGLKNANIIFEYKDIPYIQISYKKYNFGRAIYGCRRICGDGKEDTKKAFILWEIYG